MRVPVGSQQETLNFYRDMAMRLRSALNTIANSECQNFDAPMLRAIAAGAIKQEIEPKAQ